MLAGGGEVANIQRRAFWHQRAFTVAVLVVALVGVGCDAIAPAASAVAPPALAACPVTVPNGETPPGERPSPNHHGNGELWTTLPPNGRVGPSFTAKFPWWRGPLVVGKLTIEGHGAAPPLHPNIPDGYGDTGLQASEIRFPTAGCWEITGRAGSATLTFVVQVP